VYLKEIGPEQSVFGEYKGFGNHAKDYSIRLENRAAGAGVHITGSRPMTKLIYWSIRTTFCPEAYVDLSIEPGRETKWTYTYEFYEPGRRRRNSHDGRHQCAVNYIVIH